MRHLTVDFTMTPPMYTYIVDGVTSTHPARSVYSALHVAGICKRRGVSVVTIGQKQAVKKIKKGKPTMALSKSQQTEQQARFVNALQQFIDTGTITGRGSKNLVKAMERQGLIFTHQGKVDRMTDAGLAYYFEHRDTDSDVIDAAAPAEQPAVEQPAPLADLPTVEQAAHNAHENMRAFPSANDIVEQPAQAAAEDLGFMLSKASFLVETLEDLIERIPDFQVFNADAFTTRDGLLSTIDELADDAIITRLIHTIRVLNDVIDSE